MEATPALLVKYGEIALRKKNRKIYEDMLIGIIRRNIKRHGNYEVKKEQGRFFIESSFSDNTEAALSLEKIITPTANIFGLSGVSPCVKSSDLSMENIKKISLDHIREQYGTEPLTFKVESSRADKSYPHTSNEISSIIGKHLLDNMPNLKVDVKTPQVRLKIELRNFLYVYSKSIKGLGGLPAGSAGKGVLLLSGGFDSPVAGYLTARRGVELICAYFHSPPYTSEKAKEKVRDLASKLAKYTGKIKLYIVPFTDIQLYLNKNVPENKLTILMKRSMLKISNIIAESEKAQALITGDSIGQVASQTMQALEAVNSAATFPVLRPLCGMDKLDILNLAEKIGTYEISVLPYADCCTLFVAKHPDLKPKRNIIENIEKNLTALDTLLAEAASNSETINLY